VTDKASELLGQHFLELPVESLAAMRRPVVYAIVHDGEILYVGASSVGLVRILDPRHHRLSKPIFPGSTVKMWFYESVAEAELNEKTLIGLLKPRMNKGWQ
jgi:hypothetical protein